MYTYLPMSAYGTTYLPMVLPICLYLPISAYGTTYLPMVLPICLLELNDEPSTYLCVCPSGTRAVPSGSWRSTCRSAACGTA